MKALLILALCCTLAACSQTATIDGDTATATAPKPARQAASAQQARAGAKGNACDEAIRSQANSAMLGSALGMVGSFGGFGGRGGAVAAHAASTAGGMVARSQQQQAQDKVMRECHQSRS